MISTLLSVMGLIAMSAISTADEFEGRTELVTDHFVHPRTVVSPNGLFSIVIEPSRPSGFGSGQYSATFKDKLLWAKSLPFTLWSGEVTDQGTLVGYAYTHGIEGREGVGDVIVFAINAAGKMLVKEESARESSNFRDTPPTPTVNSLKTDLANDRFLVRWNDPDLNRRQEKWEFFSLSTGEKKLTITPKLLHNGEETSAWLMHTQFISGTSFVLAQFKTHWARRFGLAYAIYDDSDAPLWMLQRDGEFLASTDDLQEAIHNRVSIDGTIFDNKNPKRFDLQFIKEAQRVTFEIDVAINNSIVVKEVNRQPQQYDMHLLTSEATEKFAAAHDLGNSKALTHVEAIELKPAKVQAVSAVRDVADGFDFDNSGNIGFLRESKNLPATFVLVTQGGNVLLELELADDLPPDSHWNGAIYVGEQRFVVTCSQYGIAAQSQAWVVDTKEKKVTRLKEFRSPPVESITSFHDGGFIVLAQERFKYTLSTSLSCYNSEGNCLWTVDESYEEYPNTLFSPRAVAATADGSVCVLEGIKIQFQFFDKSGKFIRVLDLKTALGHEPNYLSDLSAAGDGSLIIYDFHGTPSYIEMTAAGTVRHRMDARLEKDRAVLQPMGPPRISPTGQPWLSNRISLLRIGKDGLMDHFLGPVLDNETLGEIAFSMVADSGEIFAISRQTNSIHRFDPEGNSLKSISDPEMLDRAYRSHPICVLPQGELYVALPKDWPVNRLVQFSLQGKRIRDVDLPGFEVHCLSNDSFLCNDVTVAHLRAGDGKLLNRINRQPDGNWLQRISTIAVAPNGSFAICTRHDQRSNIVLPDSINIYSPEGDPIQTLAVPGDQDFRIDFDGKRLAVSTSDRTLVYSTNSELLSWASHREFSGKSPYIRPKLLKDGTELILIDLNNPSEIRRYR